MFLTSGQHVEGALAPRPAPGRAFWLLVLLVLPALDAAWLLSPGFQLGWVADWLWLLVQPVALAVVLTRRGVTGRRRAGWLAAGVGGGILVMGVFAAATFVILLLAGLQHCHGSLETC